MSLNLNHVTDSIFPDSGNLSVTGNIVFSGNLVGNIPGLTENDTLATVTARGSTTTTGITLEGELRAGRPPSDMGSGTGLIDFTNTAGTFISRGVDHSASRTNVLRLMRDGTSGVVYAAAADFDLSRWEASDVAPRTAVTLKLAHNNLTDSSAYTDVMTWRSDGTTILTTLDARSTARISYAGYAGIEYYNEAGGQWQGYIGTESNSGNLRFNSYNGNHNWYSNSNSIATLNTTRLRLGAPAGNPASAIVSNLNRYLEIAVNDANATSYPYGSGVVFHHGGVSTSALSYIQPDANAGYFYFNSDDSAFAGTSSASSMRAPIFYDSADAAYYLDPASGANGISLNVQGRIQVGTFNNSQENTGEAWIGRASDRGVGTLTVQLGNDAARYFEVVDKDWTTVIFGVGMNTFGYKGNAVLHAGNYNSYALPLTGGTLTGDLGLSTGTANGVAYLNGSKVLTTGSALTFDGSVFAVGVNTSRIIASSAGNAQLQITASGQTAGSTSFDIINDGSLAYVWNRSNTPILFGINGSEQMRLTSTGLTVEQGAVFNESGADSDFRVESDNNAQMFFVDAGNDRIGIGTNTPSYQMDFGAGTTVSRRIRLQRGSDDTSQNMLIGWDGIDVTRSSVALSSPQTTFSINQVGSDGTRNTFIVNTDGGITINEDGYDADFRVESDTNTHAFFLDAGNNVIGTGTSSPSTYVDSGGVALKGASASDLALVASNISSGVNSHQMRYWNDTGTAYEIARTRVNVGAGQVNRGEYQFAVNNGAGLRPWLDVDYAGNVVFNEQGYDSDFRVESDTDTHCLFVDASANNVGIGTSSPSVKLQSNVSRTSGTNVTAFVLSDTVTGAQTSGYGTQIQGWSNNGSAVSAIGFEAYGGTNNDTGLGFYTQNTAGGLTRQMTISSVGNVGIGESSPSYKLDVVGSIQSQGTHGAGSFNAFIIKNALNSSGSGKISWQGNASNETWAIAQNQIVGAGYLEFNYLGAYKAGLDPSGNLGLGVTPSAWNSSFRAMQLGNSGYLFGRASQTQMEMGNNAVFDATDNRWEYITTNTAQRYLQDGTSGSHQWFTAASGTAGNEITFTQDMTLNSTGLGIGTTSPNVGGWSKAVTIQGASNAALEVTDGTVRTSLISAAASAGYVSTDTNHPLLFRTNATERARIASGGNVGIATQTPQYALDVYQSGIAASFGASIGSGAIAGIHFGYSEAPNTFYRKSALVFERTDNHNQGGNASGKIHFLLMNGSNTSATSLSHSVVTIDSDANGTIGSVRMGVGTTTPTYTLQVAGSFAATTKSFVIDHPTKPGKKLRYGSLEGPENGVYVRGRSSTTVIELPDYWTGLVDPDSITVQLTAIGSAGHVWVESIEDNKVYIKFKSCKSYFYFIQAERKDVEKLVVEF